MSRYRKKPVEIEAERLTAQNADQLAEWCGGGVTYEPNSQIAGLTIDTLEGAHLANIGDWIIRGVKGEFYACKPDIFEMTYEVVIDSASQGMPQGGDAE